MTLTPRQSQVLTLIAQGYPGKAIAFKLGISHKTVNHHRQVLMSRTGRHNTALLTHLALKLKLVTLQ